MAGPELSAAKWEELLKPFLDTEMLHVRETDYTLALSIFAPLSDALDRAQIRHADVDLVLLAGGSSLIPQVQWALEKEFKDSRVLRFPDGTAAQTAIARGAAWAAAWLETYGKPLVVPVVSETLALRVGGGKPIPLVERGTPIPYPTNGEFEIRAGLALPRPFSGSLRVEVVTLPDEQVVLNLPVIFSSSAAGEPINFEFRFSSGRTFECAVALRKSPDERHEVKSENPLINVSNPGEARVEIERIEEELRDTGGPSAQHRIKLMRLAELYREVRMVEKACEVLKAAARAIGRPDAGILIRQGMYYDEIGDFNRMESHYAEAVRVSPDWAGPLFSWALHYRRQRNFPKALEKIDEGILCQPDSGPCYALRARILGGLGQTSAAKEAAEEAITHFPPISDQGPWELAWYEDALRLLGREKDIKAVQAARALGNSSGSKRFGDEDLPVMI